MNEGSAAGIVLAGGHSRRMGRDKALLRLPPACADASRPETAQTLLARAFALVSDLVSPAYVACAPGRCYAGYPCLEDSHAECGPAAGILTGLAMAAACGRRALLVVPCDMPLLQGVMLRRLLEAHARRPTGTLVTLYEAPAARPQMLPGVYAAGAAPAFRQALESGEHALQRIIPVAERCALPVTAGELPFLVNCNTPEDLAALDVPAHGAVHEARRSQSGTAV